MKKITVQDIAESLHISRNTVSKVLNGHDTVSDALTQKVLTRAQELGYARLTPGLREKLNAPKNLGARNITVVIKKEASDFWNNVLNGISEELTRNGFNLIYSFVTQDDEKNLAIPPAVMQSNIEGIIVFNVFKEPYIYKLTELGLPASYLDMPVNQAAHSLKGDVILIEGYAQVYEMVMYLYRQGRRRFGFIGDIAHCRTIHDRWRGYSDALAALNIPAKDCIDIIKPASARYNAYEDVHQALNGIVRWPEAFICANDNTAAYVVQYLTKAGLKIPKDIAITGFDDSIFATMVTPHLTSVHVKTGEVGRRLAEALIKRIDNPHRLFETVTLSTQPVFRESA
jgi:LacI family transcriptional regulator